MRCLLLVVLTVAAVTCGQAQDEAPAVVAALTISLGANGLTELEVYPGTPLTISAALENGPAIEAETARAALATRKEYLAAAVADQAMTQEEADVWLAGKEAPPDAPAITVRAVSARLRFTGADGAAAPWTPRSLEEKDEAVSLDAERSLYVVFVVPPEDTASLQPGELRLVLRYDGTGAPAGEWTGEAVSEEVLIRVVERPATLTPEQTWMEAGALSEYHLAVGDWDAALADAEAMVQAVAEAPEGYARVAQAKEGKGDQQGAWEAYQKAIDQTFALDPEGCWPLGLMGEAARLGQALGLGAGDGAAAGGTP